MLTMEPEKIEKLARLYGWEYLGIDVDEGKVVLRRKSCTTIYSPLPPDRHDNDEAQQWDDVNPWLKKKKK